jgi:hypothetical protein
VSGLEGPFEGPFEGHLSLSSAQTCLTSIFPSSVYLLLAGLLWGGIKMGEIKMNEFLDLLFKK